MNTDQLLGGMDEQTREMMEEEELLAAIRQKLADKPTFLRMVILTALQANFEASSLAQKQINETGLLFSVVSEEEKARWKKKGIEFAFLKGGGLDQFIK